jgi:hypothetical protein
MSTMIASSVQHNRLNDVKQFGQSVHTKGHQAPNDWLAAPSKQNRRKAKKAASATLPRTMFLPPGARHVKVGRIRGDFCSGAPSQALHRNTEKVLGGGRLCLNIY